MKYPIGVFDFKELVAEDYHFVDKSLFVSEVLSGAKVQLIVRPRRFGKTLNLSMLRYYYEGSYQVRSELFAGLALPKSQSMDHASFPVIALTLKDLKETDSCGFLQEMRILMSLLYSQYDYLEADLKGLQKSMFVDVLEGRADEKVLQRALSNLIMWLQGYHHSKIVVLIDEYDSPMHEAWGHHCFKDIVSFMRGFFGKALKDNPHLEKAVLTGITRISKDSIFSEINNLDVFTPLNHGFNTCFGFTQDEVDSLLAETDLSQHSQAVKDWYNGYMIGGEVIYNPWSLINYVAKHEEGFRPHWVNTSGNILVRKLLLNSSLEIQGQLEMLMQGSAIESEVLDYMRYEQLETSPAALWGLLLFSGYLKVVREPKDFSKPVYSLAIPNREVFSVFRSTFQSWVGGQMGADRVSVLAACLIDGDLNGFQEHLNFLAVNILSYHDVAGPEPERVYHAFVLGVLSKLENRYEVRSNRESGFGRTDCMMRPLSKHDPGIIIEFKAFSGEDSEPALKSALEQIQRRVYAAELQACGVTAWWEVAVVCNGKRVFVDGLKKP